MYKKIIIVVILILLTATIIVSLAACSGAESTIYYEVKGASMDDFSWIKIGNGKWEDSSGEKGTYKIDGETITIYQDDEEILSGTVKDGVLILSVMGVPVSSYYTKEAFENNVEIINGSADDRVESDKNEYVVYFDANGGALTGVRSEIVSNGALVTKPSDPIYAGHTFLGWSRSSVEKSLWNFTSDKPTSDLTLYAYWEEEIKVSFSANGGKFSSGESLLVVPKQKGDHLSIPEQPSRENYEFTDWYADADLTTLWNFGTDMVNTSVTLYAGWSYNEKNVTFVLNYEGAENVTKKTVNGKVDYIPERAGYVFNGWWHSSGSTSDGYILSKKYDNSKIVTSNNLVLYAEWVSEATLASQLTAPSINISEEVFSWEAVAGAQSYTIIVVKSGTTEEMMKTSVTNTAWSFPQGYDAGYYSVRIRSNGDGINAVNSVYVTKIYAHKILPSVSGISLDISTSLLTWYALDNPVDYKVFVNDTPVGTIKDSVFDMSDFDVGEYYVTIEATYAGYIMSSASARVKKFRLRSPNVEIDLKEDCSYEITWGSVSGANMYVVRINGTEYRQEERVFCLPANSNLYDANDEVVISVAAFDSTADWLLSANDPEVKKTKAYPITLTKSDDAAGSVDGPVGAVPGEEVTLTAMSNEGYTWLGWYDGEDKVSEDDSFTYTFTMTAESKTYTAKWVHVKITYYLDGGINGANPDCFETYLTSFTLQQPMKETSVVITDTTSFGNGKYSVTKAVIEYAFLGWYSDDAFESEVTELNYTGEDIELYVKWSATISNTITTTEQIYLRKGNYINFGTYPQTKVTDRSITNALNEAAGARPSESNCYAWTSYGYYIELSVSNCMWYIDLEYLGEMYRGVYFTSYRPYSTSGRGCASDSKQDDNGYYTSIVYWFKYEPIKWRILSESNGEAMILCEMIIDSQEYYDNRSTRIIDGQTIYCSNYAESNIRKWLNETFYNTAFNELQKQIICLTTVDNSARSTFPNNNATAWNHGVNHCVCENTQDYVFLVSQQEVTNSDYSFNSNYMDYDTARQKKSTDYAKSQGTYVSASSGYEDNGGWLLRSPDSIDIVRMVSEDGRVLYSSYVEACLRGIVPALRIQL